MKINIVNAFTWYSNIIDTQNLTSSEQLILVHILKYLNRNFWKPIKISIHMLAKNIGKDDRTVKNAIKKLIEKEIICELKGSYHIGINGDYFKSRVGENSEESYGRKENESSSETRESKSSITLRELLESKKQ